MKLLTMDWCVFLVLVNFKQENLTVFGFVCIIHTSISEFCMFDIVMPLELHCSRNLWYWFTKNWSCIPCKYLCYVYRHFVEICYISVFSFLLCRKNFTLIIKPFSYQLHHGLTTDLFLSKFLNFFTKLNNALQVTYKVQDY